MIETHRSRADFDWERIQKIGLLPGVKTLRQYDERVFKSLTAAKEFVGKFPTLNPSLDYTRIVHRMVFHEVHPWAGEIRQPGRLPPRVGGFITCEPERLETELRMLESQTAELLAKVGPAGCPARHRLPPRPLRVAAPVSGRQRPRGPAARRVTAQRQCLRHA